MTDNDLTTEIPPPHEDEIAASQFALLQAMVNILVANGAPVYETATEIARAMAADFNLPKKLQHGASLMVAKMDPIEATSKLQAVKSKLIVPGQGGA